MSAAIEVLAECQAAGISVEVTPEGNLYIAPVEAVTAELKSSIAANKSQIVAHLRTDRRIHIHRVLTQLRAVQPYRDGTALRLRAPENQTDEHRDLLAEHHADLIEALAPRALTDEECEVLALWFRDIGEACPIAQADVLNECDDPATRTAYLWQAAGSPALRGTR